MDVILHDAAPFCNAEEMQPHVGMLIDMFAHDPGRCPQHLDFQFLPQLPRQGGTGRLAKLDLAAGEFPVAGVEGIGGALAEEKRAIRPLDDGGGNLGDLQRRALRPA